MKKLFIAFTKDQSEAAVIIEAKSVSNMWNVLRGLRDNLDLAAVTNKTVRAMVTDEENNLFMDIAFRPNKKGKIEFRNAFAETHRKANKAA